MTSVSNDGAMIEVVYLYAARTRRRMSNKVLTLGPMEPNCLDWKCTVDSQVVEPPDSLSKCCAVQRHRAELKPRASEVVRSR